MSKRILPGPHADRSAGIDFDMSSTPNDTPQRATAAQLATRKIKELNKRRVKPTGPSAPQTPFSFGETSGANAAPSSSTASNGFSFGQSQSFPAPSASGAAQNGSQSLSFGAGAPASFNFGGFGATPASNPFANLNGGSTQTQTQTQPSNVFGAQSSTQTAQPSGQGIFGQSSNSGFQVQPASTGTNPFAQSTATAPASTSLFQTQPASTGSSLFGQTKPASTGPNLFGQASSTAPASSSTAATTAPGSLFSQQSASAAPSAPLFQSKPATPVGSTLFGQNPPETTTATQNLFGQSAGASSAGGATATTATNGPTSLFGQAPSATSSPLFQPKPATTGTTNMFGQTATASSPGASLFGQSVAAPSTPNKASGSLFGNAPSTSASNTFNFGQTTSTSQKPLFNVTSDTDDMSTSPDGKRKVSEQSSGPLNIFGQKAAQTSAPSEISRPASSLFGAPTPPATANPPSPSLSASNNIFGQQESRSVSPALNGVTTAASSVFAPTATASTASNPFGSLFAASPNKPAETPAPAASISATTAAPTQSLFAASSKPATTTAPATSAPAATSTAQSLFAGPQPAQANSLFAPQPSPDKRLGGAIMDQALAKKAAGTVQVSAEESLEGDKKAQIIDLNRGFKEHLASYDPENQSLDSIIIYYIKMRKVIGAPVGSLTNKPGKRKLDHTHGIESPVQRPTAKKSKAQEATPEPDLPSVRPSSAGKRKLSEDLDDSPNGKHRAQPYVRPSTTQAGGKSETASIFASSFSAPKAAAPASTTSAGPSLFGFGSGASSTRETPRPASPQKEVSEPAAKPAFEVPKFGNLNFAGQFGKGSFQASSTEAPTVKLDLPKFNVSGQSFMNQFGQKAKGDDDTDEDSDSDAEPVAEKKVEKPSSAQPQSSIFSGSVFDSKPGTPSIGTNNIFGHLNTSTATSDAAESSDDDLTEQLQKRAKKSQPDSETEPKAASSLFGRITRPDGTPVNLSSDEEKAETPKPKPLFGQSTSSTFLAFPNNTTPKTSSNIFGGSSTPSTSNPFSSSLNPAAQLLAKEGTATASVTSDSNAEDTDTETVKDTQLNLLTNAGEENEECLYEVRCKGSKLVEKTADGGKTEKTWEVQGLGPLRVLVNKETKRARLLLRADPSGKAVLNTSINRAIDYKVQSGSCSFMVPRVDGSGMDFWALRFKKEFTAEVENAVKTAKEGLPK